jgi:hypothetical protein
VFTFLGLHWTEGEKKSDRMQKILLIPIKAEQPLNEKKLEWEGPARTGSFPIPPSFHSPN